MRLYLLLVTTTNQTTLLPLRTGLAVGYGAAAPAGFLEKWEGGLRRGFAEGAQGKKAQAAGCFPGPRCDAKG